MNKLACVLVLPLPLLGGCSLSRSDLPLAVRDTLDTQTANGKVTDIDDCTRSGITVYYVDATMDGKQWEISIAEDGRLISKELDD